MGRYKRFRGVEPVSLPLLWFLPRQPYDLVTPSTVQGVADLVMRSCYPQANRYRKSLTGNLTVVGGGRSPNMEGGAVRIWRGAQSEL